MISKWLKYLTKPKNTFNLISNKGIRKSDTYKLPGFIWGSLSVSNPALSQGSFTKIPGFKAGQIQGHRQFIKEMNNMLPKIGKHMQDSQDILKDTQSRYTTGGLGTSINLNRGSRRMTRGNN